jgi:DNA replication protein DnaC
MDEQLTKKLAYLRLGGLVRNWDRYSTQAQSGNHSLVTLLRTIIDDEYALKQEHAKKMRIAKARIPHPLVMETYPFSRQPNLNKKKILTLYDSLDYMEKIQDIIWIGPTGVGKSGLATAFLLNALNRGYTGRFISFSELIELLYKSVADHSEHTIIKQFAGYDCLCIDELGYIEVEPVQVGLFFSLMSKRHTKKTTLITTNLGFKQWNSFLKNDHLTAALIDRLTENSHVISMNKCVSLRRKLDAQSLDQQS